MSIYVNGDNFALLLSDKDGIVATTVYRKRGKEYVATMEIPSMQFYEAYPQKATMEQVEEWLINRRKILERYGIWQKNQFSRCGQKRMSTTLQGMGKENRKSRNSQPKQS